MQSSAVEIGTVVEGEYVLLEPYAQDGSVYRGRHLGTDRPVAIRVWQGEAAIDFVQALERLETASRIRHPSLCAVEEFGQLPDGAWFIVSEHVEGQRLDAWADQVGIPPIDVAVDLMHRVCVGLNAAHRNALAHEALHPGNLVLLEREPAAGQKQVKLLDLGVPAFMRPRPPTLQAAQFMAPEQLTHALRADEQPAIAATARMNVYSCGSLLYYLCTGGAPFQTRSLGELSMAHLVGKLGSPSKINPQITRALEAVIVRALAFDPDERYAGVAELAAALARLPPRSSRSRARSHPAASELAAVQEPDRRTTWDSAANFDERPTTVSRVPAALLERERSLPPRPSEPTFAEPAAIERVKPEAIVAEAEPTGSYLIAAYASYRPRWQIAVRLSSPALWIGALAVAAAAAVGYAVLAPSGPAPDAPAIRVSAIENAPAPSPAPATPADPPRAPAFATDNTARTEPAVEPTAPARPLRARAASAPRDVRDRASAAGQPVRPVTALATPAVLAERIEARAELESETLEQAQAPQAEDAPSSEAGAAELEVAAAAIPRRVAAPRTAAEPAPRAPARENAGAARAARPLAAGVRVRALSVRGSLTTSEVRRAVERIEPQLAACYARSAGAAGRNGFGALQVEVEIDERGRARGPHASGGALPGLEPCIAAAVAKLVASRPPDTGTVHAGFQVLFAP